MYHTINKNFIYDLQEECFEKMGDGKQQELAKKIGISPFSLSRMFNGCQRMPGSVYFNICSYIHCLPSHFWYLDYKDTSTNHDSISNEIIIKNENIAEAMMYTRLKRKMESHNKLYSRTYMGECMKKSDRYIQGKEYKRSTILCSDLMEWCQILEISIDDIFIISYQNAKKNQIAISCNDR